MDLVEAKALVERMSLDPWRVQAEVGRRYYNAHHDILFKRRFYEDANGVLSETPMTRISNPFFTEIVDQEVAYMLSNKSSIIGSEDEVLHAKLQNVFGDDFRVVLQELLESVVVEGRGWVYAYKDENGETKFQNVKGLEVFPVAPRESKDRRPYVLRLWREPRADVLLEHLEVWSETDVTYYVRSISGAGSLNWSNEFALDPEKPVNPRPHVVRVDHRTGEAVGVPLGYVPFFKLGNNEDDMSGLHPIKPHIDDYDLHYSAFSDNFADAAEVCYIVRGMVGTPLQEIKDAITQRHILGIPDYEGSVDVIETKIPYEARTAKLKLDQEAIYRFGMAFDSSKIEAGGNVTNVALKSRYALLDMKCDKLETRLKLFLRDILDVVLPDMGGTQDEIVFDFTRELMANANDNAQRFQIDANRLSILVTAVMNAQPVMGLEAASEVVRQLMIEGLPTVEVPEFDPEEATSGSGEAVSTEVSAEDTGTNHEGDMIGFIGGAQ